MLRSSLVALSIALAFWLGYFARDKSRPWTALAPIPPHEEIASSPVPSISVIVEPKVSTPELVDSLRTPVLDPPVPRETPPPPQITPESLMRRAISEAPGLTRSAQWQEALSAVTNENWRGLFDIVWHARQKLQITAVEEQWILQRLGAVAGDVAMNRFKPKDPVKEAETHVGRYAMQGWAEKDAASAWAYIEAQPLGRFREGMIWGYVLGLGPRDLSNALHALDQLPLGQQVPFIRRVLEDDRLVFYERLIESWLESGPKLAPEAPTKVDLRDVVFREFIAARIRQTWGDPRGERFIAWMEQFRGASFVTDENLGAAARHLANHRSHEETMNWLESYADDPSLLRQAAKEVMKRWAPTDLTGALQWLASRRDAPIYDIALVSFIQSPHGLPPDQISTLRETLHDRDLSRTIRRQ